MPQKINFSVASIGKEEEEAVLRVLRSGWLTTGKETMAFENEFAQKVGAKHALAVNSATSGMVLAMEACGVKPGTAVITTPYTFVSTAACAKHLGADVIFADIEANSYSIDVDKVEKILAADTEKKIVAVVPVHIAGNICDMERLVQVAEKYNVKVIEDAAHAFPSLTR
ncbi:MAG: aminotransferase class I/II-fold pyridoxal phosphate-dependent enzyme, partial [Spirochaetaceae bacterium]|nr:aminotransferase class I/II-fold pyridoxal phosphate-dependent enzyme [Spirochaetaceae bacterium]